MRAMNTEMKLNINRVLQALHWQKWREKLEAINLPDSLMHSHFSVNLMDSRSTDTNEERIRCYMKRSA